MMVLLYSTCSNSLNFYKGFTKGLYKKVTNFAKGLGWQLNLPLFVNFYVPLVQWSGKRFGCFYVQLLVERLLYERYHEKTCFLCM